MSRNDLRIHKYDERGIQKKENKDLVYNIVATDCLRQNEDK